MYAIAWRYGLDYRTLASWNNIKPPYLIYPGQALRTRPPARATTAKKPAPRTPKPTTSASRKAPPSAKPAPRSALAPRPPRVATEKAAMSGRWHWPSGGKVLRNFAETKRQGIDIAGTRGDIVRAAAPGRVVYRGGGLIGYGKLIIVKHDRRFLTAYAHNHRILVDEGAKVKGGAPIAEMGDSGTDRVHAALRDSP